MVASVQTLARKDRLSKLSCDFTTVVVDEASSRCASPCPLATVSGIVLLKRIPTRSARPSPDRAESRTRPRHSEPLRDVCPGQRLNCASDLGRSNRSEQIMRPPVSRGRRGPTAPTACALIAVARATLVTDDPVLVGVGGPGPGGNGGWLELCPDVSPSPV